MDKSNVIVTPKAHVDEYNILFYLFTFFWFVGS